MTNTEKMDRGLLWGDTDEYLEEQARAKDLIPNFRPARKAVRKGRQEVIKQQLSQPEIARFLLQFWLGYVIVILRTA